MASTVPNDVTVRIMLHVILQLERAFVHLVTLETDVKQVSSRDLPLVHSMALVTVIQLPELDFLV
jgi:hypothetical protein